MSSTENAMHDHLGDSNPNGSMNQRTLPRKPAAQTKSMGWRVFLIAFLVSALGVLGLIAETVSGDGKSPIAGLLRSANSTFSTVGAKIGSASGGPKFANPRAQQDTGIDYGPAIAERTRTPAPEP